MTDRERIGTWEEEGKGKRARELARRELDTTRSLAKKERLCARRSGIVIVTTILSSSESSNHSASITRGRLCARIRERKRETERNKDVNEEKEDLFFV